MIKNNIKKLAPVVIGFAFIAAPALVSADAISDLQAQIAALTQQLNQLIAQSTASSHASTNASFSATPSSGTAPLTVTFTGTVLSSSFTLDYGDGTLPAVVAQALQCPVTNQNCNTNPTISVNQSHTYTAAGTYSVKLTDASGNTVGTATITVNGSGASCTLPTHDLSIGQSDSDVGGDVTLLQQFLKSQGVSIYPEGLITGFFGNATQSAVLRFQKANGIAPVSGFVGRLTRASMQALCNGTAKPSAFSFEASPASGASPLSVNFTVANAETLDSGVGYAVDFGDGTKGTPIGGCSGATTSTSACKLALSIAHTYTTTGTFNAKLLQERNVCNSTLNLPGCVADLQVDSTTVTVSGGGSTASAPTCSISLSQSSILLGGKATLSYTMQNGTTLDIAGIGKSGASSGSTAVSPLVTSTYSGTVTGPGGTGHCAALLTVSSTVSANILTASPAPTCTITINPIKIVPSGSALLTYTTQNATHLDIAGVGQSDASFGTNTISPSITSTYIGTVTGPGGTGTCSAPLIVSGT